MTKTRLKRKLARLRSDLKRMRDLPFDPAGREERLEQAAQDDSYFNKTYLPMWHTKQPCELHAYILGMLNQRNDMYAAAAPRHHGKTVTWMSKAIKEMCFGGWPWVLGVSASKELIGELVEPIRMQFVGNPFLMQDFRDGSPLCTGGSPTDFRLWNGSRFDAVGRRQAKRGLHPMAIIFDDIEDDDQAKDREQVRKLVNRLIEVFYPMLPPDTEGGGVFCLLGTMLSRAAMLWQFLAETDETSYIEDLPQVHGKVFRAIMTDPETGDDYSLFPDRYPLDTLYRIRARMGRTRFLKEFQNLPPDGSSLFRREWIRKFLQAEFDAAIKEAAA